MPKGKKRATNASDGPKPKRRRAAQPEEEVEYRTLTDLPVELCNEVCPAQVNKHISKRISIESDILRPGRFGSPSPHKS